MYIASLRSSEAKLHGKDCWSELSSLCCSFRAWTFNVCRWIRFILVTANKYSRGITRFPAWIASLKARPLLWKLFITIRTVSGDFIFVNALLEQKFQPSIPKFSLYFRTCFTDSLQLFTRIIIIGVTGANIPESVDISKASGRALKRICWCLGCASFKEILTELWVSFAFCMCLTVK